MNEFFQLSEGDFAWQRLTWMRTHRPVSMREVRAIFSDWRQGLAQLPYLKVVKNDNGSGWDNSISIHCLTKLPAANLSIVQADLQRIWRASADGMEANFSVRKIENGFVFDFTGITPLKNIVAGEVIVESRPGSHKY